MESYSKRLVWRGSRRIRKKARVVCSGDATKCKQEGLGIVSPETSTCTFCATHRLMGITAMASLVLSTIIGALVHLFSPMNA